MRPLLWFILLSMFALACTNSTSPAVVAETNRPATLPLTLNWNDISSTTLHATASVKAFYSLNKMKMIWLDSFSIIPNADTLIHFINRSSYTYGLNPDHYHIRELHSIIQQKISHENAARCEVLLTDAFVSLWYHLKNGRVDRKTFKRIKIDSLVMDEALQVLSSVSAGGSVTSALEGRQPDFQSYVAVAKALKNFRNGDFNDTTVARKRDQLIATLERWRWETAMPKRYIAVNIPSFQLKVVEDDSLILESRVIIGKPETPTPNIKSVVNSFIIYPYWHVPKSILKEILPSVQADTNYLRKHNYQVINAKGKVVKNSSIDWKKYTSEDFPYVLRQREGSENTMGVIKFVFPNNYGVYLHDTNARRLFSKSDRALSHGCIRVQKAVDLAKYLAKDDDTYVDAADLEQYLLVQKRLEVKVVRPIPLYLNYFTVEPQADSVIFFKDLYKKDRVLIDSINGVRPQLAI